jgi:hypothetical protein
VQLSARQEIRAWPLFPLEGLDEIGYTLSQIEHIDIFERRYES